MTPSTQDRARGALLGLAVGDALGAPAENLTPERIRERWGRITGFVSDDPVGTDDTEYTVFSALLVAEHGSAMTVEHVERAWRATFVDQPEGPFKGAGFSERGTVENLRAGLSAPASAQHRHGWSDGLAMRAAPFGVYAAGCPPEAARLVAINGAVSNTGEGILGGKVVAAAVAAAMAGESPESVVEQGLSVIDEDSWTSRSVHRAIAAAREAADAGRDELESRVHHASVAAGYPWTDLAPEAVALAVGAFLACAGKFRDTVLMAVNMGRDADTTAAIAGAMAGASAGVREIPDDWAKAIGPVRGTCVPAVAGREILDVADLLLSGVRVAS